MPNKSPDDFGLTLTCVNDAGLDLEQLPFELSDTDAVTRDIGAIPPVIQQRLQGLLPAVDEPSLPWEA